jgi:hypothetical protein
MDIIPSIMQILGIEDKAKFDGRQFLE